MDIKKIKSYIKDSQHTNVYFCQYNGDYISYCPTIKKEVIHELKEITQNRLDTIEDLTRENYNPAGALDDTVEICPLDEYQEVQQLINSFSKPVIGTLTPEDVSFYVFEFISTDTHIYAVRRHNKMKSIRRGFMGKIQESHFSKVKKEKIYGIDDQIDLVITDDKILVINHTSFERIFNIADEFIERAKSVLNDEKLKKQVIHFDHFQSDILSNMNYVKRVAKLHNKENTFLFLNAPDKVRTVIDNLELDIRIEENGKYNYQNKTQLGEFINLMQDSYYETLIGNEFGVDGRR